MADKSKRNTFFRLIRYTKRRWLPYYIGLFGFSVNSLGVSCIFAMGFKKITDAALTGDMKSIINESIMVFIEFILLQAAGSVALYLLYGNAEKLNADLCNELFEHVQKLPIGYIENQHSGDFLSRLANDTRAAAEMYGDSFNMILSSVISGIGSGIVIFTLDYRLGIITLILGVLNIFINIFFVNPLKKISITIQEAISALNQKFSDSLVGIHVIKIFNLKHIISDKFRKENTCIRSESMKRVRMNTKLNMINTFMGYMNFAGMIVIGSIMIAHNQLTFGVLVAVTQLMGTFFGMFRRFGNFITEAQECLAGAQRVFEILDTPAEDLIHAAAKSKVQAEIKQPVSEIVQRIPVIEFRNVSFSYENEIRIIGNFNLSVFKDQVIAVVGSSGSGKSTLFKLLLSFYEPKEGQLKLFGKDYDDLKQWDIRRNIAYVPQDNYLFSSTIKENISYGKPDASEEDIIESAKAAYAHDFIEKLPQGYDTEVGERGTHLSGGQRQRIAIARALLKNAPILLLDEATSSLDSESEQQVQKALDVLMRGRTTMVIAHRLSTIQNADRILVIEDGRIREDGNHDELLSLGKIYAHLYNMQFKEVESETKVG